MYQSLPVPFSPTSQRPEVCQLLTYIFDSWLKLCKSLQPFGKNSLEFYQSLTPTSGIESVLT